MAAADDTAGITCRLTLQGKHFQDPLLFQAIHERLLQAQSHAHS